MQPSETSKIQLPASSYKKRQQQFTYVLELAACYDQY